LSKYIMRECTTGDVDCIVNGLLDYNLSKVPQIQERDFIRIDRVIERANGEIIAGILGKMYYWNCLYIDILWVNEAYRKEGFGSRLLKEVENIAKEKGCYLIHLDTFDFQAKDFYVKYGYEVFGTLDDCPQEHKRYFLKKNI